MDPLHDEELDALLRRGTPAWHPSPGLDRRIWEGQQRRSWEWLWRGSIRVPVPVAVGAALVLAVLWWRGYGWGRPAETDLNQFRPVEQLEIKLVRRGNENR